MSEEKRFLEDCPHCGGTAAVKAFPKPHRHGWVGCQKCGCYIQWQHDPGGAIEKWNRRVKNKAREIPPAAAVEVVRCWECRKGRHDPMNACIWCEGKRRTAKQYCADGERKA